MDRRQFLKQSTLGVSAMSANLLSGCDQSTSKSDPKIQAVVADENPFIGPPAPYRGPNVILVRFGGGVRRRETVEYPTKTWCPFVTKVLAEQQGTLFNQVDIASNPGVITSHGQGTLYILTGQYDHYEDITHKPFAARFEPKIPTIFEYLRRYYQVPAHQTLIVNGEDRIDEEFYTFSNHHLYGAQYRSIVLSLYRYKTFLLRDELAKDKDKPTLTDAQRQAKEKLLATMESVDYRSEGEDLSTPELNRFWERWREYYGTSGLVNPRGDRLLTALALRAIKELRPRLMMINYQDPDYVHWGNQHFYTRGIAIIDEGIRELYSTVQADEEYRDNTVFVIVPDCGRDNNRCIDVPFQHHFNTKSAHEIFAVIAGPKGAVPWNGVCPKEQQQISIASTIGEIMGFPTPHCPADSLLQV